MTEKDQGSASRKIVLIVTSIICLLPICLALVMYDDLPEKVVMQWNFEGNPNWYAHKAVIAFGIPLFFMVLNIAMNLLFYADPKRENTSKVMRIFVAWFIPVLSLIIVPLMLLMNSGVELPIPMIVFILIGLIFIFIGNYLPKSRQNFSVGVRTKWTLNDPENWNKTHRVAGVTFMIGGLLFIVLAFLPLENIIGIIFIFLIIIIMAVVPILYSYNLYKRTSKNNI